MIIFPSNCLLLTNKYYKWYCSIIEYRQSNPPINCYTEEHHIIPKGIDVLSTDIVILTAREHFIVHLLLPHFINNPSHKQKMLFAIWGICNQYTKNQQRVKINSHSYATVKELFSKSISGDNHWMKDPLRRKHLSNLRKGMNMSQATKDKLSKILKGRKILWKDKIGNANRGKKRSEDMRKKQSRYMQEAFLNGKWVSPTQDIIRDRITCKYCGEKCDIANLKKWHNENSNCIERKNKRLNKRKIT